MDISGTSWRQIVKNAPQCLVGQVFVFRRYQRQKFKIPGILLSIVQNEIHNVFRFLCEPGETLFFFNFGDSFSQRN